MKCKLVQKKALIQRNSKSFGQSVRKLTRYTSDSVVDIFRRTPARSLWEASTIHCRWSAKITHTQTSTIVRWSFYGVNMNRVIEFDQGSKLQHWVRIQIFSIEKRML